MISSKKLVNQASLVFIIICFFFWPKLVVGKVFDRVVAKVNSEIITLSSIEERVSVLKNKYKNDSIKIDNKEILREALEIIISEKLQLQQAKKMGFVVDDSSVEAAIQNIEKQNGLQIGQLAQILEAEGNSLETYKNRIREQIIVSKIKKFELGNRLKVSDRKIANYYHDHQKEFWDPSKAKVRHILLLFDKGSSAKTKKEIYKKIKKILYEIKTGKDFSEAAKEYSEDISASSGGDVGFVEKGRMVPEFEKAVYKLKEGEISDIVETEYGFHIIKVDEVQKGRTLPLNKVKNKIQYMLLGKKEKAAYEEWMKELKDSAFIEISLFKDPKKNINSTLFGSQKIREGESDSKPSMDIQKKKKGKLVDISTKKKMDDRWEKMYKSVEKSKKRNSGQAESFHDIKKKLKEIKKLRVEGKISVNEYHKQKRKLLDSL